MCENKHKKMVYLFEHIEKAGIYGTGKPIIERLNKKEFLSPFNQCTDIRGFIQDIKKYLFINLVDPKREAENYIKSIIRKNGIDNPDEFLKNYIFE
ncbi:hypothetical protein C7Q39_11945 [Staphylococcus aureus]|uniref:hypothetical protein n=1 Tax=Staphylococcus aureus TaxID=1280 RepID=UPI000DA6F672|nr:hypothetical protein [Staphylococcus aureus]MBZ5278091.1 hypothetical protein [Staphylococcus aureus]PZK94969.1 hypothetical protein C7Q39_11945 [Staphylococcus aureus]HCT3180769.1 hypothetical protein [Staphylococcus aureus]